MNNNFFMFLGATIFLVYAYSSMGKGLLTSGTARNMIRSNEIGMIVDTRIHSEWKLGHYKSAIHIPIKNLTTAKFIYITPKTGILVYGQKPKKAAEKIRSFGFENVYYIKAGYWTLLKS